MEPRSSQRTLALAVNHHRAGRYAQAEPLYQEVLAGEPDNADALHMLGVLAFHTKRNQMSMELIDRAIAQRPESGLFYLSLSNTLAALGHLPEALECAEAAAEYEPQLADAQYAMGNLLLQSHREREAAQAYRKCIEIQPGNVKALVNLSAACMKLGDDAEALSCLRRAASNDSGNAHIHFNLGLLHARAENYTDAAGAFRQALSIDPDQVEAYFHLGQCHHRVEDYENAQPLYRKVLSMQPNHAGATHMLGSLAHLIGRDEESAELLRRAIELNPQNPSPRLSLAKTLESLHQLHDALAETRAAIELKADWDEPWFVQGNILAKLGEFESAIGAYRKAADLDPQDVRPRVNLAATLSNLGQNDEAIAELRKAAEADPTNARIFYNLGTIYSSAGKTEEAITELRRAIDLEPRFADAFVNLSTALERTGKYTQALAALREVLEISPQDAGVYNNFGEVLKSSGKPLEACEAYAKAITMPNANAEFASNYILGMHYSPQATTTTIVAEQRRWDERYAQPFELALGEHTNDRTPDRKLRIGYVSPDFRAHAVGWNLLPILEKHDRQSHEIHCISNGRVHDETTAQIKSAADQYYEITGMDDESADALIRANQIDILVDLSLHTGHNRLPLFGRKPAPVQISYLGYCGSCGVRAIDYRLSDGKIDDSETKKEYVEQTLYLKQSYWCYRPARPVANPANLPAIDNGYISFGSLNNFAKTSIVVQRAWASILSQTPNSRLLLHLSSEDLQNELRKTFADFGVDPSRLEFVPMQGYEKYMQTYDRIDIALDPFPYGGGITTCDALYMGSPVVSLAGQTPVGRAGRSILTNVGLPELVTADTAQYIARATKLAADRDRLISLRSNLRRMMLESPLMNATDFTADLESLYRQAWQRWCSR